MATTAAVARVDHSGQSSPSHEPPRRPDDSRNLRSTYYWGTYPDSTADPVSERAEPSGVGKGKREALLFTALTLRQPGWEGGEGGVAVHAATPPPRVISV